MNNEVFSTLPEEYQKVFLEFVLEKVLNSLQVYSEYNKEYNYTIITVTLPQDFLKDGSFSFRFMRPDKIAVLKSAIRD